MNGIEFLRSCTTNACLIEDVLRLPCRTYELDDGAQDCGQLYTASASLREHRVLCSVIDKELWTFGPSTTTESHVIQASNRSIQFREESTVEVKTRDEGKAKDILLNALETSISFSLGKQASFLRVGSWQWVHNLDDEQPNFGIRPLLTLYVQLSDSGRLSMLCETQQCRLQTVPFSENMQPLILAGCGQEGRLLPEHRQHSADMETWKEIVRIRLASEGVSVDANAEWLLIELSEQNSLRTVLWPARLCLIVAVEEAVRKRDGAECRKQHFSDSKPPYWSFQSPLAIAEEWWTSASERDVAINNRSYESLNPEGGLGAADVIADTPLATSPPFNQRTADLQAAMSTIYPTPPDGMMPVPELPHPSFDALEDPSHANHAVQVSSQESQRLVDQSHRDDTDMQPFPSSNDDLFDDVEEIDFNMNDVADADFDYFDEMDETVEASAEQNHDLMVDDVNEKTPEASSQDPKVHSMDRNSGGSETMAFDDCSPVLNGSSPGTPRSGNRDLTSYAPHQSELTRVEQPLSPLGIRHRILPPPIPASATQYINQSSRQSRAWAPVAFNDQLEFHHGHGAYHRHDFDAGCVKAPDIRLPVKRGFSYAEEARRDFVGDSYSTDSSDEDANHGSRTLKEADGATRPPRLPWETTRARYRPVTQHVPTHHPPLSVEVEYRLFTTAANPRQSYSHLLDSLYVKKLSIKGLPDGFRNATPQQATAYQGIPLDIEELYELSKLDLVYVAQIVAEQAASSILIVDPMSERSYCSRANEHKGSTGSLRKLLEDTVTSFFPETEACGMAKLVPNNSSYLQSPSRPDRATDPSPQRAARERGTLSPQDCFSIPTARFRVQRGGDALEMFPPAFSYWMSLGLGPVNGPKNIKVACVIPSSEGLTIVIQDLMRDLAQTYEGHKLGSFGMLEPNAKHSVGIFSKGMLRVDLEDDSLDQATALKCYANACIQLGRSLATNGQINSNETLVICIFDPFDDPQAARQHLSACFWQLYKAYRENIPTNQKRLRPNDVALQIIPLSMVASRDGLVVTSAEQVARLAMEIYDRCPPSGETGAWIDTASTLPIAAAPVIELAGVPPRKVGFQANSDPPAQILFEGSVLHIGYAQSGDGRWLTICWMDSTGHCQQMRSVSLRGSSLYKAVVDIWDQTLEVLSAREVTWRVFIGTNGELDNNVADCWRQVVTSKPRKQVLLITLLTIDDKTPVRLYSPLNHDLSKTAASATTPGDGFLTPGSTPQGTINTLSPDATQPNNPPTPAASDGVPGGTEHDADAYVVDTSEETWGMLIASEFMIKSPTACDSIASGLIVRRGAEDNAELDVKGVHILWDIRLRPNGFVDDGVPKQVEANLREVLRMYRSLSALAKVRRLSIHSTPGWNEADGVHSLVPIHILCASEGAAALDGLLR